MPRASWPCVTNEGKVSTAPRASRHPGAAISAGARHSFLERTGPSRPSNACFAAAAMELGKDWDEKAALPLSDSSSSSDSE